MPEPASAGGLINEYTRKFPDKGNASLIYRLCQLGIGPIVDLARSFS
jgi:hypothetical protein